MSIEESIEWASPEAKPWHEYRQAVERLGRLSAVLTEREYNHAGLSGHLCYEIARLEAQDMGLELCDAEYEWKPDNIGEALLGLICERMMRL